MSFRKVGIVPAKVDVEKQETFKKKNWNLDLKDAKPGTREVYFVDVAHFVMGAFVGFWRSFQRVFVRSPSARKRYNVWGALSCGFS